MSTTHRILGCLGVALAFLLCSAHAQQLPPFNYYRATTNQTGAALKLALHEIIKGHTIIPYDSGSQVDTRDALVVLDRDPTNSANVLLIYSGYSVPASSYPLWNREHIVPQSFGVSSGTPNSDLFNLRACDAGVNSSRGNKYFDVSTGTIGHHANAPESSYDSDSWEPRDADKGYVARAVFYMTARYDGTGGDPNLQVGESPNASAMIFAKRSTLLDWNRRFPPSEWERTRNGRVDQLYQHNRNPFIDNPDFADMIFLGVDGFTAWQQRNFSSLELADPAISAANSTSPDGVANLVKYALGYDPRAPEPRTVLSLNPQSAGGTNYLYVTHHRNHYLSGATLTYQVSENLTSWQDVAGEVVTNMQVDYQKDLVTVRFPTEGPAAFVRFKVRRLADGPLLVADGATLALENCAPGNSVIDPNETVTVYLSVKNVGSADTANLVATLLATGGVTAPSGAQNYGVVAADGAPVSRPFTFTAVGNCGGMVTASLQLQDETSNLDTLTYTFPLGQIADPLAEDFDGVAAPSLPVEWATSASGAQSNWVTTTTNADTPPNTAYSPEPSAAGVNELVSPSFFINSASAQLLFEQSYNLAPGLNGGVLEIKIEDLPFQDILAAGGSFVTGGYNATLSEANENPLAGRPAWSGTSGGFVPTIVNLPAEAAGQNVRLRWRCGTGNTPAANLLPAAAPGTLAGWDMNGLPGGSGNFGPSPFAATATGANVTVGGLTRGSGVTQSGTGAARGWGGTGWTDTSAANAITNNRFATFTVQANPGFKVSFSSISKFDYRRSSTGPANGLLQYRVGAADSFHDIGTVSYSSVVAAGGSIDPISLSGIAALQNVAAGTVVTFRIVNWGGTSSVGTWYIFDRSNNTALDFEIQGEVTQAGAGGGSWLIDSILVEDPVCCGNSP